MFCSRYDLPNETSICNGNAPNHPSPCQCDNIILCLGELHHHLSNKLSRLQQIEEEETARASSRSESSCTLVAPSSASLSESTLEEFSFPTLGDAVVEADGLESITGRLKYKCNTSKSVVTTTATTSAHFDVEDRAYAENCPQIGSSPANLCAKLDFSKLVPETRCLLEKSSATFSCQLDCSSLPSLYLSKRDSIDDSLLPSHSNHQILHDSSFQHFPPPSTCPCHRCWALFYGLPTRSTLSSFDCSHQTPITKMENKGKSARVDLDKKIRSN